MSAYEQKNEYVFPRRIAIKPETEISEEQIPIDDVLEFLEAIAEYTESETDGGKFIPRSILQLLILPKSDVKAARNRVSIPYDNAGVAREAYAALPPKKESDLPGPFSRAHVIGRTLVAKIDGNKGLGPERQAVRQCLTKLAGGVRLDNLPPIEEHPSLTLGHFVGDVSQDIVNGAVYDTNAKLNGFSLTFRQVEYGWSQDIASGMLVPQSQSE